MNDGDGLRTILLREDLGERLLDWVAAERERLSHLPDLRGRMGLAILGRFEHQLYALAESGSEHAPLIAWALHGHARAQIAEAEIARRDQIERERDRGKT